MSYFRQQNKAENTGRYNALLQQIREPLLVGKDAYSMAAVLK